MGFFIPKKWTNIIGLAGFCLLLAVFALYISTSSFFWYIKVILGLGLVGVLAFWILNFVTSKATRYGSNIAITIMLAFAILVLVNFVSAKRFKRFDTTQNKFFSLSDQTEKILKELNQDINVIAFYTDNHYRRKFAQDILNEYAEKSGRIKFSMIDPASKPGIASTYKVKQDGTVVFETGNRRESINSLENEEQDFTSAILKLTAAKQKKVYFLSGHGEKSLDDADDDSYSEINNRINADNYIVEKLVLAQQSVIPDDCEVLIIAGPQNPLLDAESEAIIDYLDLGGKAIIMVDTPPAPSLDNILAKWGIDAHNDIILDDFGRSILGDPSVPVCITYGYHPITTPLSKGLMTFFPLARSLSPKKDANKDISVTELVKTSNNSWGETNLQDLFSKRIVGFNEGNDIKGPLTIAVVSTIKEKAKNKERRVLIAFGDSDFISNKYLQQGNPDLFMNSLNWLAEDEELISIRPKSQAEQTTMEKLSNKDIRFVSYSSIFAIPLLLILIGARVWWKRR